MALQNLTSQCYFNAVSHCQICRKMVVRSGVIALGTERGSKVCRMRRGIMRMGIGQAAGCKLPKQHGERKWLDCLDEIRFALPPPYKICHIPSFSQTVLWQARLHKNEKMNEEIKRQEKEQVKWGTNEFPEFPNSYWSNEKNS
ncbi:hypothetical protein WR25_12097 [Diploscapter pachys]|uniref:Uncharacterized protein n=1 Tax=Diploscapter pachys TaxID=2018661 RepID=A0A2A2JGX2_9BILA|nr:hypothetical protein WR25_12097 [Diploscapter pachys]